MQHGFTCATKSDGTQYALLACLKCMLCNVKLSNSSLAPAKLREHFTKVHGTGKYKDNTLNQFKQKRAKFDANATITSYGFAPIDKPILTASYEVAYLIAKQGKPHIIGETLVKLVAMQLAKIMLEKEAENKLSFVPLSNDLVKNRINDIGEDILSQVVADLKASPTKFIIQLDETTDVANLNQLIAFVRYVKGQEIKEEFLFCKQLITTAKAIDLKNILDDFFTSNGLSFNMVSAVCINGAFAMIGCKSGLRGLIKSIAPHIAFTHCMLHKHALVSKMLPSSLADVLKIVVETVNFVKVRALNHWIFMQLCEEMDSKFNVLLYHTEVRWLSRGKVMNRVFALRAELLELLKSHNNRYSKYFEDSSFILTLAFLADIFGALNPLSTMGSIGPQNET